ncbi:hypothetical protein V8E53_011710 [Lactarius tabidus]
MTRTPMTNLPSTSTNTSTSTSTTISLTYNTQDPCLVPTLLTYRVLVFLLPILLVLRSRTSSRLLRYPSFHPRTDTTPEKKFTKWCCWAGTRAFVSNVSYSFFMSLTIILDSTGL